MQTNYFYNVNRNFALMTTDGRGAVHARRSARRVWQPESSGDADVILWDQGGVYSTDCNKNVVAYNIIPEWPDQPSATYYDYTPFGVPVGNAGSAKRFMFSSEEWFGAYGLYLYLYRAYSPVLARFLTRDPIEENGGANLYCFVGNNPIDIWDVEGLFSRTYDKEDISTIDVDNCEIVIFDGHGSKTKPHKFVFSHSNSAAGFTGCYSNTTNSKIVPKHKIPGAPSGQGEIIENSMEKDAERKALASGALLLARDYCKNKNGNHGCCKSVKISITSNVTDGIINSLIYRKREAEYVYSCKTEKIEKIDDSKFTMYNPYFGLKIPRDR